MNRAKSQTKAPLLGFGIIGAGAIFEHHARALGRLGDVARLLAVADVDPGRLQTMTEKHFVPFSYTDYGKMLQREDIDVVVVATPPALHEQHVREALEAGKFVNCEKPLAPNLAAADRMIEMAHQNGQRLSVGYQLRFSRDFQKLRWICHQNHLGKVTHGEVIRREVFSPSRFKRWWGQWQMAGGGVVMTQFIHQLDLLTQLFGSPRSVSAEMSTRAAPIESEDTFECEITFPHDVKVRCEGTIVAEEGKAKSGFEVVGERGRGTIPFSMKPEDRRVLEQLRQQFPEPRKPSQALPARAWRKGLKLLGTPPAKPVPPQPHEGYYRALIQAIHRGEKMPVTPEDARTSLDLCAGIYASAIAGCDVNLPLDNSHPMYEGVTPTMYHATPSSKVEPYGAQAQS